MAKKIPFRISARTARLIGRQNFPNSEGAIIELVKNSYDADADTCIVVFDNRYATIPNELPASEYQQFLAEKPTLAKFYRLEKNREIYLLEGSESQANNGAEKQAIEDFFRSKCKLYIIDNGEGMTGQIIEDFWMTIGTNNKEVDVFTTSGRVKTGAKGIGRFALDKLGDLAEMLTVPSVKVYPEVSNNRAFLWQVDWNFFEGDAKTLNQVEADLIDLDDVDFVQEVRAVLPAQTHNATSLKLDKFSTGTRIEISGLRDTWDDYAVGKLFANLEVLIPPREERIFNIFLFSTSDPEKYGQVAPSICDDYDYKVEANVDADGKAEITIYRNEFDVEKFSDELFGRELMQKQHFTKEDFEKGKVTIVTSLAQLAPGLKEVDTDNILEHIGAFEFVFYFLKNQASNRDRKKFFYTSFNAGFRKKWLNQFGGIKLFRDNFRVRPYGEPDSRAFDWLLLGERAGQSPQSIGQQRSGTWRVRPNQISGIINISRLTNIQFEDTSSRYGLQENRTFDYFTQIIKGILDVFENDRTQIGKELSAYDEEIQKAVSEEKAQTTKREIRKNVTRRRTSEVAQDPVKLLAYTEKLEADSETLVQYTEQLQEQIEVMKNETNLLRILATNALVIASFTHELKNIKNKLVSRISQLRTLFEDTIDEIKVQQTPDFLNPFMLLEDIKNDDEKLKQWLHYSLETLRKDKRRRTNNDLLKYFPAYKESWQTACDARGVKFELILPPRNDLTIRVFEADLDSIFNNLLINSFEAFLRSDAPPERVITIRVEASDTDVHFIYQDSGPGLSTDIINPETVFEPHETTKRDPYTGEEVGTGIGMWLVKSLVEENNGTIDLLNDIAGFGVSIKFHNKLR